jgi:predicted nucleotidyltransferase
MAESALRRRKRALLAASWNRLTPAQRIRRASVMTNAGLKLRAAGRKAFASEVRETTAGRDRSPFQDLERVLGILRELKLEHALIGGWAVIAWGSLRTSEDIDLMVDLPPSRRKALLSALSPHYQAEWLAGGEDDPIAGLVRAHPRVENGFPVDFLTARGPQDRAALSRAAALTAEGVAIPIVQAEDLIAMKLEAGGGQDYEDARQLLSIRAGMLNEGLLTESCRERKALDRLALLRR